jgi:hypothetical protein
MPNVVVHERGCTCLLPPLPRPAWMDQECEARWERDEAIALELADGTVAPVVLGTTEPAVIQYGVHCVAEQHTAWWPTDEVSSHAAAYWRKAQVYCAYPHGVVTRPLTEHPDCGCSPVRTDCCDPFRWECETSVLFDGAGDPDVRACRTGMGCDKREDD